MHQNNHIFAYIIKFALLFFTLFLFTSTAVSANSNVVVTDDTSSYTDFKVDYLIEKPNQLLTIEEVSTLPFTKHTNNAFSFGYKKNNFWFRFTIQNNSNHEKDMVLELTEVIHKTVDLYVVSDTIVHQKNGLRIPVQNREIKESTPSFPLHLKAGEHKEIYLKVATIYGLFGAIHLKTEEQYQKDIQLKKYLYLAYFSGILMIMFYNIVIFLYLRDKMYFYYISYVFVFMLWAANFKGILLPYTNIEIYNLLQMTIPIFFTLLILFSQSILETKKYFIRLHRILNGFIVVCIVTLIWMSISIKSGFYFMNIVATPLLPFLLIVAIWALYKKHTITKIYLPALTVYILGMILLSLMAIGILPYTVELSHAAMIGAIFEIVLFSLLLAYRISIVRKESLETREQLLKQQKTESTRLFHAVAEKTMALNLAKKELEEELAKKIALEKHLKHLASTDPLTGLYNRRAFFDICDVEMKNARTDNTQLTCLIIDIDHFKHINDTYGHDIGDKVISTLAKLMIDNTRTMDYIGRIGGEEFAVLMPNTDMDSAFQIADRLRENIAKNEIILNPSVISISVSIGLSYLTHEDKNIHTLLKRADTALYEAKENGRNQVCYL